MNPRNTPLDVLGRTWKRLDTWLARWGWAPSAEGLVWFLFSAVVLIQGLSRGFNLVTFIATFLLSMWLINMLVVLLAGKRLKRLECKRKLHGMVHAGSPVLASLEVHNPGYSSVHGLRVQEEGPDQSHAMGFSVLSPLQTQDVKYSVTPRARGPIRWEPLQVSTGYPFGLARRTITKPVVERDSIVLPMLGQLDQQRFQQWLRNSRRASSLQTRQRARRTVAPADFYGIRNYRAGDSARWIHWRSTARVGYPMVREFEEPPQDQITIILEAWLPDTEAELRTTWKREHQQNLAKLRKEYKQYGKPAAAEREHDLEELRVQERSVTKPLDVVEQAVSLAASLCNMWTRRLGSNITLGIIDGTTGLPAMMESGPNMKQLLPLMERLAMTKATPQPSANQLMGELRQRASRSGSILLISTHASTLVDSLSQTLNRPVQLLDMSKQEQVRRFFNCPVQAV